MKQTKVTSALNNDPNRWLHLRASFVQRRKQLETRVRALAGRRMQQHFDRLSTLLPTLARVCAGEDAAAKTSVRGVEKKRETRRQLMMCARRKWKDARGKRVAAAANDGGKENN